MAGVTNCGEADVPFFTLFCGNLVVHAAIFVIILKQVIFQILQFPPVTKKTDWHARSISTFVPSPQPFTFDMLGNWQLSTDGANQNVMVLL